MSILYAFFIPLGLANRLLSLVLYLNKNEDFSEIFDRKVEGPWPSGPSRSYAYGIAPCFMYPTIPLDLA